MKKQENTKQKLFEMVNKLEPSFKLTEEYMEPTRGRSDQTALKKFIYIDRLLGNAMTEEQAIKLMDDIRNELSIEDIQILKDNVSGPLYSHLSEYDGEMGGLSRY